MARSAVNPDRPSWVAGVRPVQELLEHRPLEVERILVARESTGRVGRLLRVAREAGIPVSHVERDRLAARAGRQHATQGIVAQVAAARYAPLAETVRRAQAKADGLLVLVDRVTDAGNLGAILRTSAGAGADAVILSREGTVGLTPHVIRASAGAIERIPVCREGEPGRRIEALREAGFLCLVLDPRGEVSWTEVALSGKVLVVAGGEERGARPGIVEKCDNRVAIPLERGVESLNVAGATGVLLFELRRQRRVSRARG
jgi:23S rRNA (guanosine2251-2'-O)-methyltransferase